MGGRKLVLEHFRLATDQSMAASFNSNPFHCALFDNIYIQMNCVGTMAGTFAISVSGDHKETNGVITNAGNFIPLTLPQVPTCAGADIYLAVNVQLLGAPWMRVEYTRVSGTGVCNLWLASKMI